ncbi:nucleotidyltransferase family protein [Anianabacter salinae]|uniref:nucleotidyltransferase family protein n=1 Tax=Anianabacter salinae TaxID=2851023 RepID=UPI00225DFEE2|nr:nucleotidyltransferase family protein [Anianabacter salinae]MBV0913038.1 nucleotidyltransferase family protein [Anianabacter salinae]
MTLSAPAVPAQPPFIDAARRAILALCSDDAATIRLALTALSPGDWPDLAAQAHSARMSCLLDQACRDPALADVPPEVRRTLSERRARGARRALALQAQTVRIHDTLTEAGVPHLFLKGLFLAPFCYPGPELRPARDIDVLVPETDALRAWTVLAAPGKDHAVPDAVPRTRKHLPHVPVRDGEVTIEVHTRIADLGLLPGAGEADLTHAALAPRAIARSLGGRTLRFPGATDQALHLCIHAALEHRFNNGSLTLCDLRRLVQTEAIDWPRLWDSADRIGAARAVLLTVVLAERFGGLASVPRPERWLKAAPEPDPEVIAAALDAMCPDARSPRRTALPGLRDLRGILLPSPRELAAVHGGAGTLRAQAENYVRHWKRIGTKALGDQQPGAGSAGRGIIDNWTRHTS